MLTVVVPIVFHPSRVFRMRTSFGWEEGRIYSKRGPCSEKMWGP